MPPETISSLHARLSVIEAEFRTYAETATKQFEAHSVASAQQRTELSRQIQHLESLVEARDKTIQEFVTTWRASKLAGKWMLGFVSIVFTLFGWLGFPAVVEALKALFATKN